MLFHDPYFNPNEGGLNLLTIDDARPVGVWSHYHAQYALGELAIAESRAAAIRWALDDLRVHGPAEQVPVYEAQLAAVEARRAAMRAQCERLEAARAGDPYAPRVSPFPAG